jgi:hypothetical protein
MTLQEILYGTWMPPEHQNTTTHRIGFASSHRYEPPKVRQYVKVTPTNANKELTGAKKKIFAIMKQQVKPISAFEMAKKVVYSQSHCSIALTELFKLDLLERKKMHGNGTRYYLYSVKRKK